MDEEPRRLDDAAGPEGSYTRRRFLRAGAAVSGGLVWAASLGAVHARAARTWPLANASNDRENVAEQPPTGPTGPTAAALRSFTAKGTRFGSVLRWKTASEAGIVGFNLYRHRLGRRTKLNRRLIRASGSVGGAPYVWRDRTIPRATSRHAAYWLEVVSADGSRQRYGPAASAP